ncbi:MAG: 50S ribosomal protein L29 [Actinomycetota bacterium]|nr:50S ribosomal protein L29 [Acidimicrobiia bacterium]MDQ3294492.1 50S ribosomal protein L29 [Actinomycetota bacterium]
MPTAKAAALRDLPDASLLERLVEEKDTLLKLRFRLVTGQLDNHAEINRVRRDIARVNTEIRARQIAAAEGSR